MLEDNAREPDRRRERREREREREEEELRGVAGWGSHAKGSCVFGSRLIRGFGELC